MAINPVKLASVGKFILGLGILTAFFLGVPTIAHTDLLSALMGAIMSPLIIFVLPVIFIGLYFTFSAKIRWRVDIFLLIIVIVCFSSIYQFIKQSVQRGDIRGETKLEVTVVKENETPVADLEVDVGEKPGTPPQGGVMTTDEKGVATFYIRPGLYVIYFNAKNFPKDLEYPQDSKQVRVEEGKINQATVTLKLK